MESLVRNAGARGALPAAGLMAPAASGATVLFPERGILIGTTYGCARVVTSARHIEPALWAKTLAAYCKDRRYYDVVEGTIRDAFEYRYAVLKNDRTGATAVQPFFLVNQDIVAGMPGFFRAAVRKVRKTFPRFLTMKIVMVGCAAGEGQLDSSEPWAVEALAEVVDVYARQAGASMILLKDFPSSYRGSLAPLTRNGYKRVPSMPGAKLPFHFASFEEYMVRKLSRISRKGLRRKFRDAERAGALTMEVVEDATPFIEEIYPLYLQTFQRSQFRFEELTKDYFCQLGRQVPERVRFFLWRQKGRLVAFSACMIHDGVIDDLNVGLDYAVALDLHLYFITWRDIVSWALEQGLKAYHTGPLNYDPKLHLRLELTPLDLYARHVSRWINPFFGLALAFLQPARYDPAIWKFRNAHEV